MNWEERENYLARTAQAVMDKRNEVRLGDWRILHSLFIDEQLTIKVEVWVSRRVIPRESEHATS